MTSFRNFTYFATLSVCSLIVLAHSFPFDSSHEDSLEKFEKSSEQHTMKPSSVVVNSSKDKSTTTESVCANRHDICRIHGSKLLPCCKGYVCKVAYGEYHCFEHWETTS